MIPVHYSEGPLESAESAFNSNVDRARFTIPPNTLWVIPGMGFYGSSLLPPDKYHRSNVVYRRRGAIGQLSFTTQLSFIVARLQLNS